MNADGDEKNSDGPVVCSALHSIQTRLVWTEMSAMIFGTSDQDIALWNSVSGILVVLLDCT